MVNYQNMKYYEILVVMLMVIILLSFLWRASIKCTWQESSTKLKRHGLPPGPRKWPVIGNILQIGWPPHEAFTILAKQHGPMMTLWLGSMCTIVISSKELARVMFKNHDIELAGRKLYEVMKGDYNNEEASLITAQYGPRWRMLRRLCTDEFFVSSRIDQMTSVRSKCVDQMVHFIKDMGCFDATSSNNAIDVGRFFFLMAFNLIGNLIFSKDLLDKKSERGAEFFYHTGKVMELAGKPNVADYFPLLKWSDPQGLRRKTQFHVNKAFDIAGEFLKERMEERQNEGEGIERKKDYLDVLLECRKDESGCFTKFSSTTINVVVFEMFTAGTDTTTSTLEWAMAELLKTQKTLEKVQHEIRSVIGHGNKIEEKDIDNLPYLKAVIKETLRLHPPLPFLVPHMAMKSCNMLQYHIPKEAQILVNVWAIGRDPKTWKDPLEFRPERFSELSNNNNDTMLDYKGQHFEYLPFGSGRRMCPAVPLVSRVLPLALGAVLHSFDWVLPEGLKAEDLDMKERMGITLRKAIALKAIPIVHKA